MTMTTRLSSAEASLSARSRSPLTRSCMKTGTKAALMAASASSERMRFGKTATDVQVEMSPVVP